MIISKSEAISTVCGTFLVGLVICAGFGYLKLQDLTLRVNHLQAQVAALGRDLEAVKAQQDAQTDALLEWHSWYAAKRLGFAAGEYFADRALKADE